jgi:hypothetical protein
VISARIASAGLQLPVNRNRPTLSVPMWRPGSHLPQGGAYKADLDHFRAWGGDILTTDVQLAAYLAEQATILKAATLTRRLAAISVAHKAQRLPSPVSSPLVRATMRGVRHEHGTAQRQAVPLLREDLFVVLGRWKIGSRTSEMGLCC